MSPPVRAASLSCVQVATLPVPGWEAFFGVNDCNLHDLAFYVWLVSDGRHNGIIDLGLPPSSDDRDELDVGCQRVDERSRFRDVKSLAEALAELHIQGTDIDYVMITQTITYHTGGLGPELLPRAHVYLAREGLVEMLTDPPGHPPPALYFTEPSWCFLRTLAAEGRLHAVNEPVEVAPGVVFEPTGGHHPGSAGVRLSTTEGTIGLLETAFLQRNVNEVLPIGIAEDVSLCRRVIRRFRGTCDEVLALHDPGHASRFAPPTSTR
jgi:glyoxylase-like metal-dependent hydrolase (beta-lactamase superfamily II)